MFVRLKFAAGLLCLLLLSQTSRADTSPAPVDSVSILFQSHLATITVILTGMAIFISILSVAIGWMQISAYLREMRREEERKTRDKEFDQQLMQSLESTTRYTTSSRELVEQMTGLLSIHEQSRKAFADTQRLLDERANEANVETDQANRAASEQLSHSIWEDGAYATLRETHARLDQSKAKRNETQVSPEVGVVEGMYQSLLLHDNDAAVRTWQGVLRHSGMAERLGLQARTHYYIGLSDLKLGQYTDAQDAFNQALTLRGDDRSYTLGLIECSMLRHATTSLTREEIDALGGELERLYAFIREGGDPRIGRMPAEVFREKLVYLYAGYLIHIRRTEEGYAKAQQVLDDELKASEHDTPALLGVLCALRVRRGMVTVKDLTDYMQQARSAQEAALDPLEEFSIKMRIARYLGRRAVLKEKAGNLQGRDDDLEAMAGEIGGLRARLGRLRRQFRTARIYSPLSRTYERFEAIDHQLRTDYTLEGFQSEMAHCNG